MSILENQVGHTVTLKYDLDGSSILFPGGGGDSGVIVFHLKYGC